MSKVLSGLWGLVTGVCIGVFIAVGWMLETPNSIEYLDGMKDAYHKL